MTRDEAEVGSARARAEATWRGFLLARDRRARRFGPRRARSLTLGEREPPARSRRLQLQSHSYEVMILARTMSGTMARVGGIARTLRDQRRWQASRPASMPTSGNWPARKSTGSRRITADNAEQHPANRRSCARRIEKRGEELSLTALSTNYKQEHAQALGTLLQVAPDGLAAAESKADAGPRSARANGRCFEQPHRQCDARRSSSRATSQREHIGDVRRVDRARRRPRSAGRRCKRGGRARTGSTRRCRC